MAVFTAIAAAVGLASAAYGAYSANEAENAQAEEQARIARLQQEKADREARMAEIKNIRERRQEVRRAQRAASFARARGVQAGLGTGMGGTASGVQGAIGSIGSQSAANLGYFSALQANQEDIFAASTAIMNAQQEIGRLEGQRAQAQAIGALGGKVFKAAGGFGSIFGESDATKAATDILAG